MSVAATLSESLVESTPGRETTVRVRVLNDGDLVDELDLAVLGEPRAWARVVPDRVFLMPGDSAVAEVVFAPPRAPSVPAGVRRFGVRVRSREDPDSATVEEGTAIVAPFADLAVTVRPRLRRRRGRAAFDVVVENDGNAPADVALTASDAEDALRCALSPGRVVVDPGVATVVALRVRPRRPLLVGVPRAYPVTVRASYGDGAPVADVATYLQRAFVPAWAVRVALLLVALVLLLVTALVAALDLPPKARTSARHSTTTEEGVARAAQAAARAQQQAADAAAEQVSLARKQQAATPPPGPLTTPFGTSLAVVAPQGGTGTAAVERDARSWPPASGLALTDLVLMNRAGDTVEVRVLRSGVLLFDLHADSPGARAMTFASPVVLAKDDTLTVEVTCTATTVADPPPRCETTVYLGGFLTGSA